LADGDTPAEATVEPVRTAKIEARGRIATEVLGEIDWSSETTGYCTCPGKQSHTTGDGERDCEVFLEHVPTIYCFHNHCRDAIKATNRKLRSLISQAERNRLLTLPDPIDGFELLGTELPFPPELVCGILHQGSKMVIGGGSKTFKTWTLIDLAISVATGTPWWGFKTNKGRVLYLNFEIQNPFFKNRLASVLFAKDCAVTKGQLTYMGLRGKAADLRMLMPEIIAKFKDGGYSLIIFDPIYKGLGDRDENKAGDIASLLNEIESLAVETGAAVAFGHHFSKGHQANKDSIDRIGGSGVFARDPDTILTMTKHEQDDAFTIDPVLRNFPPVEPFVVRRVHPLMLRDDKLNPKDLKKPGKAQQKYSDDDILEPLKHEGKTTTQWIKELKTVGISESGFHVRRRGLEGRGLIKKQGRRWALT
jgi:AAA domain